MSAQKIIDGATDENTSVSHDDLIVHKLGYEPELSRGLNSFMNFAIGFTEVGILVSVFGGFSTGYNSGGPTICKFKIRKYDRNFTYTLLSIFYSGLGFLRSLDDNNFGLLFDGR